MTNRNVSSGNSKGTEIHESLRARTAFDDYVALGPERSLQKLAAEYQRRRHSGVGGDVPTVQVRVLERWYSSFSWQARLRAQQDQEVVESLERLNRERELTLHSGPAVDLERVRHLKETAEREFVLVLDLLRQMEADPDANDPHLDQRYKVMSKRYDTTLRAIAEECGGRQGRLPVDRPLTEWAVQLSRAFGYDEDTAIAVARMMEAETRSGAPSPLGGQPRTFGAS